MSKRRDVVTSFGGGSSFGGFGFGGLNSSPSQLSVAREPLDLSGISDPAVVVTFKNLSKQSEITKFKALEEIQNEVEKLEKDSRPLEDAFLAAWASLYPRLSVDSSRNVRVSSHNVMGKICRKEKKRIVPHLGKICGAWLAGQFDSDKTVATAALRSLSESFGAEKLTKFLEIYQESILQYCSVAIFQETVQSLSDERSVSPDDAAAKYALVISSGVLSIAHLLKTLDGKSIEKMGTQYDEMFSNQSLYSFGSHEDGVIRKAVFTLISTALQRKKDYVTSNQKVLSSMLRKAAKRSQSLALIEFLDLLNSLAKDSPDILLSISTSKSSKSLSSFLRDVVNYSLGPSPQTQAWSHLGSLGKLLQKNAPQLIPTISVEVKELLGQIKSRLSQKPGPRNDASELAIWKCLLDYSFIVLNLSTDAGTGEYLIAEIFWPVVEQHFSSADTATDNIAIVCQMLFVGLAKLKPSIFRLVLLRLQAWVIETTLDNGGEQEGQKAPAGLSSKWPMLTDVILKSISTNDAEHRILLDSMHEVFFKCLDCATRTGQNDSLKILAGLYSVQHPELWSDPDIQKANSEFLENIAPTLVGSASSEDVFTLLSAFGQNQNQEELFKNSWRAIMQRAMVLKNAKFSLLTKLLRLSPKDKTYPEVPGFSDVVKYATREAVVTGQDDFWDFVKACYFSSGSIFPQSIRAEILSAIAVEDIKPEIAIQFCKQLEEIASKDHDNFLKFISSDSGAGLLSKVLSLSHENEGSMGAAEILTSTIREAAKATGTDSSIDSAQAMGSLAKSIRDSVFQRVKKWMPLDILLQRGKDLRSSVTGDSRKQVVESLLFTDSEWETAFKDLFGRPVPPSVALTNLLEGAVFILQNEERSDTGESACDDEGYSVSWRMAAFTAGILEESDIRVLPQETRKKLLYSTSILVEAGKDNLDVPGAQILWKEQGTQSRDKLVKAFEEIEKLSSELKKEESPSDTPSSSEKYAREYTIQRAYENAVGDSSSSFYNARVLCRLWTEQELDAGTRNPPPREWTERIGKLEESLMLSCALSATLPASELGNIQQKIIRQITSKNLAEDAKTSLSLMTVLGALLNRSDLEGLAKGAVSPSGLRFLVNHILEWAMTEDANDSIRTYFIVAEIAKVLLGIMPALHSLQGDFWFTICDFIRNYWNIIPLNYSDEILPALCRTVRLYKALRNLDREGNDDLEDAWSSSADSMVDSLSELLMKSTVDSVDHVPREICYSLLQREISNISLKKIKEYHKYFKLLSVKSETIQSAAFDVLHKYVPSIQEEISIEVAVTAGREESERFEAHLPPELLSILLDTPSIDDIENFTTDVSCYLAIRRLILAWLLVFDHFQNCTFLVKSKYLEELGKGGYAVDFWNFMVECLDLAEAKPFDASSYSVDAYDPSVEEDRSRDLRSSLLHILYLALKNTPSLVTAWWRDIRNRQLSLSVETLVSKYYSPLIIREELEAVRQWRSKQETTPQQTDDSQGTLSLKISPGANEVIASYTVDQQSIEIAIRMPPSYPLQKTTVDGIARVGISETQFASVIRVTQATMSQHSGSIVEALIIYKKNLDAYLGGIRECAICYSILSLQERAVPQKQCPTCKNKFHSSCLFKWFKSSGGSTCPLCRTAWRFQ